MCGIAGSVSLCDHAPNRAVVRQMATALSHRGPDARGFSDDPCASLAHCRLSIIDLEGGAQPMTTADGALTITFNGEIFNYRELRDTLRSKGYRFQTQSDTEVLLRLFEEEGDDCVRHLNGQWAFAVWDRRHKRLFASRDRFGVRPLFWTETRDRFMFASEIKALLASADVRRELDLVALDQVFTYWFTLPPRTAFKNICELPPGHSLEVEDGTVKTWRYWDLDFRPEFRKEDERECAEDLRSLLLDATRLRLRADVPVACYLSGGLDSTLVTALAARESARPPHTFSVSFDHNDFDESSYQRAAAEFIGTYHHDLHCTDATIADVFPRVIWHAEKPLLRSAPAPMLLLSSLVREHGYKVVLSGEGADETFGGYDLYKETKIRMFCAAHPGSKLRPLLLRRLYPYSPNIQHQPEAFLRTFFGVTDEDRSSPFLSHLPRWRITSQLKRFFTDELVAETRACNAVAELLDHLPAGYEGWSAFERAEYLESKYLLPGYILSSQGDRMAMANSVEIRMPFLDHRVVEFAAALPSHMKMRVLKEKYLLKRAGAGLVPEQICKRKKQPYRAPLGNSTLANSEWTQDVLSPQQVRAAGLFKEDAVTRLVNKFRRGGVTGNRDDMALVGIVSTHLLVEQFISGNRPGGVQGSRSSMLAPDTVAD